MVKSIEEQIEDWAKKQLSKIVYYTKTEGINPEIEKALKIAPSKKGGKGTNYPDIKLLIQNIPVMIEVKGIRGNFIKTTKSGEVDNKKKDGTPNFININRYAVNGAIHYATAIVENTKSYNNVIAIGINGYDEDIGRIYEVAAYYVSSDNFCIPQKNRFIYGFIFFVARKY